MAWVVFQRNFPFVAEATPGRTTVYQQGCSYNVTREVAAAAFAAGAATRTRAPSRAEKLALERGG